MKTEQKINEDKKQKLNDANATTMNVVKKNHSKKNEMNCPQLNSCNMLSFNALCCSNNEKVDSAVKNNTKKKPRKINHPQSIHVVDASAFLMNFQFFCILECETNEKKIKIFSKL